MECTMLCLIFLSKRMLALSIGLAGNDPRRRLGLKVVLVIEMRNGNLNDFYINDAHLLAQIGHAGSNAKIQGIDDKFHIRIELEQTCHFLLHAGGCNEHGHIRNRKILQGFFIDMIDDRNLEGSSDS